MARTETNSTSIRLEHARRRIARWRETRTHRGAPMPTALWAAAVAIAQRDGLYQTARGLGVDYGSLKRRLNASSGAAAKIASPAFIEVGAARPTDLGACVIEVTGRDGRQLRVEVSGLPVSDLVVLTQGVWTHAA